MDVVAHYGKTRCSKATFRDAVLENGGTRGDAERLWDWLMEGRAERGVRDEANYFSWNHLLLVAEGEPSVELSHAGIWQPLVAAIEQITRVD